MRVKNRTNQTMLTAWFMLCLALQLSGSAHAQTIHVTEWKTLSGHADDVNLVIFSPNGKILASGSEDSTIKLWLVETGSEIRTLSGHSSAVYTVAFSPDGEILASSYEKDSIIKLWFVETGREIRTLSGHSDGVKSIAFGSYFCRFKAGDFAAMRKMVLANEECKVCLVNFIEKKHNL